MTEAEKIKSASEESYVEDGVRKIRKKVATKDNGDSQVKVKAAEE